VQLRARAVDESRLARFVFGGAGGGTLALVVLLLALSREAAAKAADGLVADWLDADD